MKNFKKVKNVKIFLFSVATMISFTQCTETPTESVLEKPESRGKTISALMNNTTYMKEVMDSMQVKHGGMSGMGMSNRDMKMDETMMNKMMEQCKTDTTMCKMMMDKTMAMCDADSSMCKMMMGSMKAHPKTMKSMKDMDKMKDMKMK